MKKDLEHPLFQQVQAKQSPEPASPTHNPYPYPDPSQ